MDKNTIKIRKAVRERGITALYHFTPLVNLESILINGLLSRCILDEHSIPYTPTDGRRYDGQPDAISLSIHDINWSMFSVKLKRQRRRWAIIEFEASVLWTHACRFCWANAASREIRDHRGFIGGPWAFDMMFEHSVVSVNDDRSCREVNDTPDYMPTRNDAEVQVLEPIAPELIRDVTVASDRDQTSLQAWMEASGQVRPIVISPDVFVPG